MLPCDHLPLELPLKVARSQRKKLYQANEDTQQEDDSDADSEDDWFYYLPSHAHPQISNEEENIGQRAGSETTGVHPKEREEQERLIQLGKDPGGIDLLDTDEAPEELEILGNNPVAPPLSPPPHDSHSESEQAPERPRRERPPPKLFTYNEFGNLVCYSVGSRARSIYTVNPDSDSTQRD